MPSIVAHSLAGMGIWGLARRTPAFHGFQSRGWYAAAVAASVLPDIDALIGLEHRGITHTLGFSLTVTALVAASAAFVHRRQALVLCAPFAVAVLLHALMDFLTGGGGPIRFFWPLVDRCWFPVAGGLPLHYYTTDWTQLPGLLSYRGTLFNILVEVLIFGPLFAASILNRRALSLSLAGAGFLAWAIVAIVANIP